jgi:peptide/nickel transport system substrate-binding protein
MTRRAWWAPVASIGTAALLVASLGGSAFAQEASPDPAAETPAVETPAAETPAVETPAAETPAAETPGTAVGEVPEAGPIMEYPNYGGEVDCENGTFNGQPYAGQVKRISAPDDQTVVFELCNPDPAFLAKISFASFAINDTDYLLNNVEDGTIVERPNGTGPYRMAEWRRGDQVIFEAFEDYWGDAPVSETAVLRWSSEPGQKFIELQAGAVDGIDNVQPDDVEAIEADESLELFPREGFNIFYVGMNRDHPPFNNGKVRRAIAQGIDRQSLVDQFYPAGSEVASHFTPCLIPFACEGEDWYDFDPEAARELLEEGLAEEDMESLDTTIAYRVVDRAYLPLPDQVALAIADQLQQNLGINATPEEQESTTFIDNANAGALTGLHLLGWNGDYPDVTNFLDYHFGAGATPQFGRVYGEIAEALNRGNSTADEAERQAAYEEANNLLRQRAPMVPIVWAGSATAWRAGIEGAHSSPLGNEKLYVVDGGEDGQLVFMQSGEPGGLYCADESDGESLRVCEQVLQSLYGYEVGGFGSEPALAEECAPNDELTEWTCTLREGVTFHDGSTFEAGDVVLSYAVQWDYAHPLHIGRTGDFSYWSGVWGPFLNAPAEEE